MVHWRENFKTKLFSGKMGNHNNCGPNVSFNFRLLKFERGCKSCKITFWASLLYLLKDTFWYD